MKQTEMFRKTKPKFCCWIVANRADYESRIRICNEPAVVMIHKAAYCPVHAEQAQKMFGPATPITT